MKNIIINKGLAIMAGALLSAVPSQGEDVEAKVRFNGSLQNNRARQTVQGVYKGEGEYGPFNSTAKIDGTVHTKAGQRPSQTTTFGNYRVQVYARARKGDASASDTFNAIAEVRRRYINFRGYGKIYLDRPVAPRKPGRQILRGQGTLHYDF